MNVDPRHVLAADGPARGHDRAWRTAFVEALRSDGYDRVLSIEDEAQPAEEGVEEAAALMLPILNGMAR